MASPCVRWNQEFDGKDDQLFLQQRVHDFLQGGQVTSDVACGSFEAQHNSGVQHMRETYMSSFCPEKSASENTEQACFAQQCNATGKQARNELALILQSSLPSATGYQSSETLHKRTSRCASRILHYVILPVLLHWLPCKHFRCVCEVPVMMMNTKPKSPSGMKSVDPRGKDSSERRAST